VLKPNMAIAGKKGAKKASVQEVAEKTVKMLKNCVPGAVPGIAFLSGGQSDEEATAHLDAMNKIGGLPWKLTFSYGRALQAAPQKAWSGKAENILEGEAYEAADVSSVDLSFDATKVLFTMKKDESDQYHVYWAGLTRGEDGKFSVNQLTFGPYDDQQAIWAAGYPTPSDMPHVNAFAEQHLGQLQGMNRAAFYASLPPGRNWLTGIDEPAPGGESFMDLYRRTCGGIEEINAVQAGRDIIAVAHGGTIRAAVGLALGGLPDKGLAFDIDNCSVTRLDHLSSANYTGWRLPMVNQQPWIADASHNAMHQPAGPEVTLTEKKLA
jgi:hypothetical protein